MSDVDNKLNGVDLFGNPIKSKSSGPLADKFGVPPFTVLDARGGNWQDRKRAWIRMGIRGELGRNGLGDTCATAMTYFNKGKTIGGDSGSIFDPMLCETMYRWFVPKGGQVVDPFSGGSVRGVVAAMVGLRYWGCDLRPEQVAANNEQGHELVWNVMKQEKHGRTTILTETLPGGTKERAVAKFIGSIDNDVLVYASPREGYAQIALARACSRIGKKAVIFLPKGKELLTPSVLAKEFGAELIEVKPGYLSNIQAKARDYAAAGGHHLLPFGLACEEMIQAIADVAKEHYSGPTPKKVWCASGSGTLAAGLARAFPDSEIHAVKVGHDFDAPGATIYTAPEKFQQDAQVVPPFSSCMHYDAKIWQFAKGSNGLLWNVAESYPNLVWACGDSNEKIKDAPKADFIFSCPPYGSLEKYSDDPADISNMTHEEFLVIYREIIAKSIGKLKENRFACFVVGDFRDKSGKYMNFVSDTIKAFEDAGAYLYNEAIMVTPVGTAPVRATKQFDSGRKLCKLHQNVLVFCKGDWKKAAKACIEG